MPYIPTSQYYANCVQLPNWAQAGVFRNVQGAALAQIHIYATLPVEQNYFSDGHVTLQLRQQRDLHYYYQVNNGVLVPQNGQGTPWANYGGFQAEAETEMLAIIQYARPNAAGMNAPAPVFNLANFPEL